MQLNHLINTFKLLTGPYIMGLIRITRNTKFDAYLYLALHGTYGVLWCTKEWFCPDYRFHVRVGLVKAAASTVYLLSYWVGPTLLITFHSGQSGDPVTAGDPDISLERMVMVVGMYAIGLVLHFGADIQKYTALQTGPHLIQTGLFYSTRNPNYLGELLIYSSFALVVRRWVAWGILWFNVLIHWIPSMIRKDRSLARYPQFPAYVARSGLLFPRLHFR